MTERSQYDAQGTRVSRTRSGVTTLSIPCAKSTVPGLNARLYSFNGHVVAKLDGGASRYVHADHLGSMTLVTGGNRAIAL